MKPKVSVIVPNFNHSSYLEGRLESIFKQSFKDFEVIILDDCSTDHSRDIIERFRNYPQVSKIEINLANSGSPFKQWNKGVDLANGEYIWIAESDDEAEQTFLETLVAYLDNDLKLGIAYCQSLMIDHNNKSLGKSSKWTDIFSKTKWETNYRSIGIEECANCLAYGNTIPNASAVLFRKDLYVKTGGADISMRVCGDWLTWLKILNISDLQFHAVALNKHRYHLFTARDSIDINSYRIEFEKVRDFGCNLIKPFQNSIEDIYKEVLLKTKTDSSNIQISYSPHKFIVFLKKYPFLGLKKSFRIVSIYIFFRFIVFFNRMRIFIGRYRKVLLEFKSY